MLYGNYVASGRVRLDKTLAELGLDDIGGLTAREKEATIEDLLSARSGVYHAASNPGDNLADASCDDDDEAEAHCWFSRRSGAHGSRLAANGQPVRL